MSVRVWATLSTRTRRTELGLVLGQGGSRPRPAGTNAVSFKGFLDMLHFENYFLSFGANSKLLGEVTRVPWIWNDSRALDLGIISGYLESEWSQSRPRALGLGIIQSTWTSEFFLSAWRRGVFPKHLDSKYSRAPSHSPEILHCFDL